MIPLPDYQLKVDLRKIFHINCAQMLRIVKKGRFAVRKPNQVMG